MGLSMISSTVAVLGLWSLPCILLNSDLYEE